MWEEKNRTKCPHSGQKGPNLSHISINVYSAQFDIVEGFSGPVVMDCFPHRINGKILNAKSAKISEYLLMKVSKDKYLSIYQRHPIDQKESRR